MILWRAFGSIFGVWNVFQSSGIDFRLVAVGGLAPLAVDAPFGAQSYGHTLLVAVAVLVGVMALFAGRGRRLRRRRALSFAIGWFCSLVLAGAWLHNEVFWWPAFGTERPEAPLLPAWPVVVLLELVGLVAAIWVWRRFGLHEAGRRRTFAKTGRLAAA